MSNKEFPNANKTFSIVILSILVIKNVIFWQQARRHVVKSGPAEVRVSAEGTSEGESTRGGIPPLVRGVRGISPEKFFDLWLPLCAFLMHFGCFQPSWAD